MTDTAVRVENEVEEVRRTRAHVERWQHMKNVGVSTHTGTPARSPMWRDDPHVGVWGVVVAWVVLVRRVESGKNAV